MADLPEVEVDASQLPNPTSDTPATPVDPTQSVLNTIQTARQSGKGVRINFSNLHPSVDKRQVVGALMDGLPDADQNQINAGAMGGKGIAVDYRKYPNIGQPTGGIYQDYPVRRALSNYVFRPAAEIGGQVLGGAAGAALGTPEAPGIGTVAAGMAGATAGGTAADEAMNYLDTKMGLAHPEETMKYAPTRIGEEALNNAAMVVGGAIAGRAAGTLAAPFKEAVNPEIQAASKALQVPVTAAQQSGSKVLQQLESLVSKLPGSADIMSKYVNSSYEKMLNIAKGLMGKDVTPEVASSIGDQVAQRVAGKVQDLAQSGMVPQLDPVDIGKSVQDDVLGSLQDMAKKAGAPFEAIKKLDTGNPIPTPELSAQLQKVMDEGIQHPAIGDAARTIASGPNLGGEVTPALQKVLQQQGVIPPAGSSLTDLMDLRSKLSMAAQNHLVEGGRGMSSDRVGGAFNSLIGALDKDIQTQAPQVGQQYQIARQGWAQYAKLRDNSMIRNILSAEEPESLINQMVRPERQTNLMQAMNLMSPDTQDQVRGHFTNSLIENSKNPDGQFIPQKLKAQISKFGPDTLAQAAGPDNAANLNKMANLSDGSFSDPGFRDFISQLGRKDGENVSSFLLQPNNALNINRTRALIGEPAWKEAQDGMVHNLLTNNQGNIDFGGLGKRMDNIGSETLGASLEPEKIGTLRQLATLGKGIKVPQSNFGNPSGTAPMMGTFWLLRQTLNQPLNALKVLGTISGGTEAYLNPSVTKWLTTGAMNPEVANTLGQGAAKIPIGIIGNTLQNPYKNKAKQ